MVTMAMRAVLAVVAYSAQFDHPLTADEIAARLLMGKGLRAVDEKLGAGGPALTGRQVREALEVLVESGVLIRRGEWFAFAGRLAAFERRMVAERFARAKQPLIDELVTLAQKTPWISGIAITGSFAAGSAGEQDDVDFLVVTRPGFLWLTRAWLLFQSWRRHHRPHLPGGDISHSWDLNLWLDETRLQLPAHRRSVYEAYEILQTRWVFDRDGVEERFWQVNGWVKELLARAPKTSSVKLPVVSRPSFMAIALNWLFFALQIGYRTLRHGAQKADLHSAFFHPSGTKNMILTAWKSWYQRALGRKVVLATGVFDVLHTEHKKFLTAAKKAGDYLLVGLEADGRVRASKGHGRPVNPQQRRITNLQRWRVADEVFALPEQFDQVARERMIAQLRPHILAVSAHSPHLEAKRAVLKKFGGRVKVVLPHNPAVSTTHILSKRAQK